MAGDWTANPIEDPGAGLPELGVGLVYFSGLESLLEAHPETVDVLSKELEIPKNMMFMGSLTETQDFSLQDLGGVRVIW